MAREDLAYRPEIDGLRAIAVLSVVAFHAGATIMPGGFVGVDVFFVISGYLITSILIKGSENRLGAELLRFYERRIRRLFPAFFLVLATGLVVASVLFGPQDLVDTSKSGIAAALSASNIYFWRTSGYFDGPAELKPFLHTWSLGTEEQFYLVFPVFIWFVLRTFKRPAVAVIFVAITLGSLALSHLLVVTKPAAAFYLLPSRAWELSLGSMLALGLFPHFASRAVNEALAALGLALIVGSVCLINADMLFPGLVAVAPCLGTALLIHATARGETLVGSLLRQRAIVLIGLMSYSLYLWHWPILVFARYGTGDGLSGLQIVGCLALTALVSALSWRFVEQPVRRRRILAGRTSLFVASAVMVAIPSAFAVSQIWRGNGAAAMVAIAQDEAARGRIPVWSSCQGNELTLDELTARCTFGDAQAKKVVVVIGDSHAPALLPVLIEAAGANGMRGVLIFNRGCAPLVGVASIGGRRDGLCSRFAAQAADLGAAFRPAVVLMPVRWPIYANGWIKGHRLQRDTHFLSADGSATDNPEKSRAVLEMLLTPTVKRYSAARLILVHSPPTLPDDIGNVWDRGGPRGFDPPRYVTSEASVASLLRRVAEPLGAEVIDTAPVFCVEKTCRYRDEGGFFFTDDNHLSVYGTSKLREIFTTTLAERTITR